MKQRCAHCGGRFGLIRHRWYGHHFCRARCREAYLDKLANGSNGGLACSRAVIRDCHGCACPTKTVAQCGRLLSFA
jgi:hypothetical protein